MGQQELCTDDDVPRDTGRSRQASGYSTQGLGTWASNSSTYCFLRLRLMAADSRLRRMRRMRLSSADSGWSSGPASSSAMSSGGSRASQSMSSKAPEALSSSARVVRSVVHTIAPLHSLCPMKLVQSSACSAGMAANKSSRGPPVGPAFMAANKSSGGPPLGPELMRSFGERTKVCILSGLCTGVSCIRDSMKCISWTAL